MHFLHRYKTVLLILFVGVLLGAPLVTHAFSLSGIIIGTVGYILWIAAGLFDNALNFFVLQMGGLIRGTTVDGIAVGVSIDIIWKIVRDIVNLTFIFGLVYVGFRTILDAGTDTKKMLASIIISALLVNFSLFISKAIIDVSNVTASEIYKGMGIGEAARAKNPDAPNTTSEAFMARMGILKLIAPGSDTREELVTKFAGSDIGTTDGYLAFVVGASLFILVASFVFAAGAFLLAIRFGALVILMMLSPIAFAATVFPAFKTYRDKWWNTLLQQAFFAPAYLFMLYATLKVAEGYATETRGFDKIFTNTTGFVGGNFTAAVFFTLTIVMMCASLVLAKQMGAIGASHVVGFGKKIATGTRSFVQRRVGGATLGTVGALGRNTIGAVSSRLAQSQRFQEIAGRSKAGELALRATRGVATSSFDARTVAGVGAKLGIGEGKKGGFEKKVEEKTAKKEAFAATLRTPAAREAYAARQAGGLMTQGGSDRTAPPLRRAATILGTLGRSSRIVASRILNNQLAPLETQEQNLQVRENQLAQQVSGMNNEIAVINAAISAGTATPQQVARLTALNDHTVGGTPPVPTNRNSVDYVQYQLTTAQADLTRVTTETGRIRGLINAGGLTNRAPLPHIEIVNPVTGRRRAPRADEQNF